MTTLKKIPFRDAPLTVRNTTELFLRLVVRNRQLSAHYRVATTQIPINTQLEKCLGVVPSTINPPGFREAKLLQDKFDRDTKEGFIEFESLSTNLVGTNGLVETTITSVASIEPARLSTELEAEKEIAKSSETHNQHNVLERLPYIIKRRWNLFSSNLQAHILSCMSEYLQEHSLPSTAAKFPGTRFHSLKILELPKFPVDLSNGEIWDLMEVCSWRERNQGDLSQVVHPNERLNFTLKDLKPVPLSLAIQHEKRATNALRLN